MELTLESLAARLEALEQKLAAQANERKDWRKVVGRMEDNEFTRAMLAEIEAASDAERRAAQEGRDQ